MIDSVRTCPDCGAALPEGVPSSQCPACLFAMASGAWEDKSGPEVDSKSSGNGKRFCGPYELLEEISAGGMGVVYRARDTRLDRVVALKLMRTTGGTDTTMLSRFELETKALATLDHAHIVTVFDGGVEDGQPYLGLKLIEGLSLAEALQRGDFKVAGGDFKPVQLKAVSLLYKLADAVQHAHDQGILHRDIKPANVLLDRAGEPYLTDFGLAKLIAHNHDLTREMVVLGTLSYMSPEQASGELDRVSPRSDIYGLGAVLYELLTGGAPVLEGDTVTMIRRVQEEEPKAPREANPLIDRDLEIICLKCLRKNPGDRYATARDLALDLNRWRRGEPIHARPVPLRERAMKWMGRHRLATALMGTAGLFGITVLIMTLTISKARHEEARRQAWSRAEAHLDAGEPAAALQSWSQWLRSEKEDPAVAVRLWSMLVQHPFPSLALPHSQQVVDMSYSHDGHLLATSCEDGTVRVWNTTSGDMAAPSFRFSRPVYLLTFPTSSDRLLLGDATGMMTIWDWQAQKALGEIRFSKAILALEKVPQSELCLVLTQNELAMIDRQGAASWKVQVSEAEFHTAAVHSQAGLVVAGLSDGTVRAWGIDDGSAAWNISRHQALVRSLSFDGQGKRLLSAADDGVVQVWDLEVTREPVVVWRHAAERSRACLDPSGRWVASAAGPVLRLWDTETGKAMFEFAAGNQISSFSFHPQGAFLMAAADDGQVSIFRVPSGRRMGYPAVHYIDKRSNDFPFIDQAIFSPEGWQFATTCSDNRVRLWPFPSGQEPYYLWEHAKPPAKFQWDAQRQYVWGMTPEEILLQKLSVPFDGVSRFSFPGVRSIWPAPSKPWALAEDELGKAWIVHMEVPGAVAVDLDQTIADAAWDTDAERLAVATDQAIHIADPVTGKCVEKSRHLPEPGGDMQLHIAGQYLAAQTERDLWFWSWPQGQEPIYKFSQEHRLQRGIFSPQDDQYCVTTDQGEVWLVSPGEMESVKLSHSGQVWHAAYHSDGSKLVCVAGTGLWVWDTRTGKRLPFSIPAGIECNSARFNEAGSRLAVTTVDGAIMVFDAETGMALSDPVVVGTRATDVGWAGDGLWVLARTEHGPVLWEMPPEQAQATEELLALTERLLGGFLPGKTFSRQDATDDGAGFGSHPWVRWMFASPAERTVSPLSNVSFTDYLFRTGKNEPEERNQREEEGR